MGKDRITKREREQDATEKWLSENDPEYAEQKKNWQTPSTDALARENSRHSSLADLKELEIGKHRNS